MIKSWKHKGLKAFYETGKTSGIINTHTKKLKVILQLLNVSDKPERLKVNFTQSFCTILILC